MHVAYLCCFQMIWSCWRPKWKKQTWSCQTTRPPGRIDALRPQQTTLPTWPSITIIIHSTNHSTTWSSTFITFTRSLYHQAESHHHHSLDQSLHQHGRVSPLSFTRPITLPTWPRITIIIHSTNHTTTKSSTTTTIHSTNPSTTWSSPLSSFTRRPYSTASFRVFSIPHSTRHSSTRKRRRLQLITRPSARPPGSSTVLNPSQYCVVLSIRVSEYFAISSMYFTFSKTSFYLVLFRRPSVLDLL